jgi:hypothetical protein
MDFRISKVSSAEDKLELLRFEFGSAVGACADKSALAVRNLSRHILAFRTSKRPLVRSTFDDLVLLLVFGALDDFVHISSRRSRRLPGMGILDRLKCLLRQPYQKNSPLEVLLSQFEIQPR